MNVKFDKDKIIAAQGIPPPKISRKVKYQMLKHLRVNEADA